MWESLLEWKEVWEETSQEQARSEPSPEAQETISTRRSDCEDLKRGQAASVFKYSRWNNAGIEASKKWNNIWQTKCWASGKSTKARDARWARDSFHDPENKLSKSTVSIQRDRKVHSMRTEINFFRDPQLPLMNVHYPPFLLMEKGIGYDTGVMGVLNFWLLVGKSWLGITGRDRMFYIGLLFTWRTKHQRKSLSMEIDVNWSRL